MFVGKVRLHGKPVDEHTAWGVFCPWCVWLWPKNSHTWPTTWQLAMRVAREHVKEAHSRAKAAR